LVKIDLNADVGEGYDDRALIPYLTSVNVACGGHAGDARTMADTVAAALELGVAVGAHPSYPDRQDFGRRELALPLSEIESSVREQVHALAAVAAAAGVRLVHVKPHGALYNVAAREVSVARAVARAVRDVGRELRLVGLAGSLLLEIAEELGLAAAGEGFADRRYRADGSLAPRTLADAVILDPEEAAEQALRIARDHAVVAVDGTRVGIRAETLCIHGDARAAPAIARAVRDRLLGAGVEIRAL
jgi:5-oxoprolinase (ATP-hydrolysing) subunit A